MLDLTILEGIDPKVVGRAWNAYLDRLQETGHIGVRIAEYAVWADGFKRGWLAAQGEK